MEAADNSYKNVIRPNKDIYIQVNAAPEGHQNFKSVTFFIRNDNTESDIRFATIAIHYRYGIPQDIRMGYFPSLGHEDRSHGYHVMNSDAPEFEGLHSWLGGDNHKNDFAPWKTLEQVSAQAFEDYGKGEYAREKEGWKPDFENMDGEGLEELRDAWLNKLWG
jgi:hypothetical protein